jgi:type I restriction enzyme S subunit
LADVADVNPRVTARPSDGDEVAFVPMAQLDAVTGRTGPGGTRRFSEVAKGYTLFRNHDLLVAKITPCFENNKIGQAQLAHPVGVGSTEFHVVRPNPRIVDTRYLLHFLRQDRVRAEGERRMTGSAGQRRVPPAFLEGLKLPLPPLDEQRRIAAILDLADALRAKRRQALAYLDDLVRSAFLDMFGDPVTNSRGLAQRPLAAWGRVMTGNTPPRADSRNYGHGIEWIKSDNLVSASVFAATATERLSAAGEAKARVAPAGSILVTCIAGSPNSIGNCAMVDRPVAFNQQINALTLDAADPYFVLAQLRVGKRLIQEKSTGGMKGLVNKSSFVSIRLLDPPALEQARFARLMRELVSSADQQRASARALGEMQAALQSIAFGARS